MTACILLAGGLGTRLRKAVPDVPKCLAPVGGRTFLHIQMGQLASQGIARFILSLGHRADQVIKVAKTLRKSFRVDWVVEPQPLGTGGAVLFAMHHAGLLEALVANADTFLEVDFSALLAPLDPARGQQIRMAAVRSVHGARFGGVAPNAGKGWRFMQSGAPRSALVNTGLYRIHRNAFANLRPGRAFSLESDLIAGLTREGKVEIAVVAGRFTDIGVPKDYFRFCERFNRSAHPQCVSRSAVHRARG